MEYSFAARGERICNRVLVANLFPGVNADEILKPDPLLVHSREEIERLQNANAMLEDKVRDLEETLVERDCCDDPCASVHCLREKIRCLRERFALEKKEYWSQVLFSVKCKRFNRRWL